ncbi:hypothetical protein B0H63DRAFT_489606 [Podospora didyma]|uniref:Rhodopsin domain-containing protein n=1 Tax=Podospora didyma TaxID=330526 RepID=A0AAE0K0F5_9PEZI|nr:hypothetical protein B0H63DRAFT_489606 [Podospora didyma]
MLGFVESLTLETWTLYSIGIVLIACRMVSRRMKLGGWTKLKVEDWLMVFVTFTYTIDMFAINEVAKNGSNFISPEAAAALTPKEVDMAIYGSKMVLVLEIFSLTTIWFVKLSLLIMYYRLTVAFEKQHLAVKLLFLYCVIAYILVVTLCLTYWCSPIQEYWRVPVLYPECASFYKHMIFATFFNISSDLMLLVISASIIVGSRLPLKRKIVLGLIFSLGTLNVLIAILNRYYNFTNPNDLVYTHWYVAEMATAVYVGNIPLCWQLISHVFKTGSWSTFANSGDRPRTPPSGNKRNRFIHSMLPASLWSTQGGTVQESTKPARARNGTAVSNTGSEEAIFGGIEEVATDGQDDIIQLSPVLRKNSSWNVEVVEGKDMSPIRDFGGLEEARDHAHVERRSSQ